MQAIAFSIGGHAVTFAEAALGFGVIVVLLLERLSELTGGVPARGFTAAEGILGGVLVLYVPWYLLKAMRRVYAQSWWKTVPKFALLGLAYLVCLVFTGVGLLFYTALTI